VIRPFHPAKREGARLLRLRSTPRPPGKVVRLISVGSSPWRVGGRTAGLVHPPNKACEDRQAPALHLRSGMPRPSALGTDLGACLLDELANPLLSDRRFAFDFVPPVVAVLDLHPAVPLAGSGSLSASQPRPRARARTQPERATLRHRNVQGFCQYRPFRSSFSSRARRSEYGACVRSSPSRRRRSKTM
jgi:hypothetical protein